MSASPPSQFDAASLIERYRRGELPREFVLLAARAFLPLAPEDLVAVLAFLSTVDDGQISSTARTSLGEQPRKAIVTFAADPASDPAALDALAKSTSDPMVLEPLLRNRATGDETFEFLAPTVGATLQEVIVTNQERILRRPAILEQLLGNPSLTGDVRRRALEIREEFFEKKRAQPEAPAIEEEIELTPQQQEELDALIAQAKEAGDEVTDDLPSVEGQGPAESAWQRILNMTVSQKVMLAFRGGLTERSILVRSRNRLVCSAVIRSPRVTDSEIEGYAAMRNVEDEVLRLIGSNRQWMGKYSIVSTLVRNPKSPIGVVLPLINRLTLKDLKSLSSDKNVSEAVRQSARRLYNQRKTQ